MQIRVGLKTYDLTHLDHKEVCVWSDAPLVVRKLTPAPLSANDHAWRVAAGQRLFISAQNGILVILSRQRYAGKVGSGEAGDGSLPAEAGSCCKLSIATEDGDGVSAINFISYSIRNNTEAVDSAKPHTSYRGTIEITAREEALRVVLDADLETYVQGVLQSEVPGYFRLEAMKAQAVVARTYGLHPRLSHAADGFNVCDSYLHCQAFYGLRTLTALQRQAISSTKNQLLLYQGKPALALFSACAGGHTEDYQNCFSDPVTDAFPPAPIPYLQGVAEGQLPAGYPAEAALRKLFAEASPATDDAWSPHSFKWKVVLTADALEGHMHHIVQQLSRDPQFAPFIKPPPKECFGHIKHFEIGSRGIAGTAISLLVHTSAGIWTIEKELTIRSIFENPEAKLKRLKSARIFFDYSHDALGLLASVTISGFGSGHGVGMQQIGAQGLAAKGLNYRQIIRHYYQDTEVGPFERA